MIIENIRNIGNRKIEILIIASAVVLVLAVVGLVWMLFTAEDRSLAKLAKDHPQGEKFLTQYRDAKEKLEKDSKDFGAYFEIGFVKAEFKDYQGAVEAYKKSIEFNPNSIVAMNNLADVYIKLKKYPEAESSYLQAISTVPGYAPSYFALVDLYQSYYTEKKSQIESVILKGLKVMPKDQNMLALLAGHYRDTKQNEKAVEIYEKILELRPDDKLIREEINNLKAGKD